jgi:hypothetical protein
VYNSKQSDMIQRAITVIEYLESGSIIVPLHFITLEVHFLDFLNSLLICKLYRQKATFPKVWLETLLSCFLLQYGGLLLSSLILGQPSPLLLTQASPLALFLAWWVTFLFPRDLYWRGVNSHPIYLALPIFCTIFSNAFAITFWGGDLAAFNIFHRPTPANSESCVLMMLCSSLSYAGSDIISNVFNLLNRTSYTINKSPILFQQGDKGESARASLFRASVLGAIYYIILNPSNIPPYTLSLTIQSRRGLGHIIICFLQSLVFVLDVIGSVKKQKT